MSAQHLTRDIYLFQCGHTHTCSQSYCKKPERRRVVVDGEELLTWFYMSKFPIDQVIYEIESRIPSMVAQFSLPISQFSLYWLSDMANLKAELAAHYPQDSHLQCV